MIMSRVRSFSRAVTQYSHPSFKRQNNPETHEYNYEVKLSMHLCELKVVHWYSHQKLFDFHLYPIVPIYRIIDCTYITNVSLHKSLLTLFLNHVLYLFPVNEMKQFSCQHIHLYIHTHTALCSARHGLLNIKNIPPIEGNYRTEDFYFVFVLRLALWLHFIIKLSNC